MLAAPQQLLIAQPEAVRQMMALSPTRASWIKWSLDCYLLAAFANTIPLLPHVGSKAPKGRLEIWKSSKRAIAHRKPNWKIESYEDRTVFLTPDVELLE
jgi:hypothetical protein